MTSFLEWAHKLLATQFGLTIFLHLTFEISKNYLQHAVLFSVMKPSINVLASTGQAIVNRSREQLNDSWYLDEVFI